MAQAKTKYPFRSPPFKQTYDRVQEELYYREMEIHDAQRRQEALTDEIWYTGNDGKRFELHRQADVPHEMGAAGNRTARARSTRSYMDATTETPHESSDASTSTIDPAVLMEMNLKRDMQASDTTELWAQRNSTAPSSRASSPASPLGRKAGPQPTDSSAFDGAVAELDSLESHSSPNSLLQEERSGCYRDAPAEPASNSRVHVPTEVQRLQQAALRGQFVLSERPAPDGLETKQITSSVAKVEGPSDGDSIEGSRANGGPHIEFPKGMPPPIMNPGTLTQQRARPMVGNFASLYSISLDVDSTFGAPAASRRELQRGAPPAEPPKRTAVFRRVEPNHDGNYMQNNRTLQPKESASLHIAEKRGMGQTVGSGGRSAPSAAVLPRSEATIAQAKPEPDSHIEHDLADIVPEPAHIHSQPSWHQSRRASSSRAKVQGNPNVELNPAAEPTRSNRRLSVNQLESTAVQPTARSQPYSSQAISFEPPSHTIPYHSRGGESVDGYGVRNERPTEHAETDRMSQHATYTRMPLKHQTIHVESVSPTDAPVVLSSRDGHPFVTRSQLSVAPAAEAPRHMRVCHLPISQEVLPTGRSTLPTVEADEFPQRGDRTVPQATTAASISIPAIQYSKARPVEPLPQPTMPAVALSTQPLLPASTTAARIALRTEGLKSMYLIRSMESAAPGPKALTSPLIRRRAPPVPASPALTQLQNVYQQADGINRMLFQHRLHLMSEM